MSYLEMKYNLLMSYCTFLSFYMLLKVEGRSVENHPVVYKLTHIKTLFEKLKPLDAKLQYQIEKMASLTEASAAAQGQLAHKPNLKDLEMLSDERGSDDEGGSGEGSDGEEGEAEMDDSEIDDDLAGGVASSGEESAGAKPRAKGGKDVYRAPKLTAVDYEDKKDKKKRQKAEFQRKRLAKTDFVDEMKRELGDEPEEVFMGGVTKKTKAAKFMDALEREEMEAFRRVTMTKKEKRALHNRNLEGMQDKLETLDDDFAAVKSIMRRTTERQQDAAVESAERDAAQSKFAKSLKQFIEKPQKKKKLDAEKAQRIEHDKREKSKRREEKAARKEAAQKEFQQAKLQEIKGLNEDISRKINYDIMKAKGIVRKRKKEDKNPRVKKRHQYEKLVKKHNTKVQAFKDGKAQGLYAGESQGLRSGLIKSSKLS